MKKKSKASKIVYWITVGVLIFIIVICAVFLIGKPILDKVNDNKNDKISASMHEYMEDNNITRPPVPDDYDVTQPPTQEDDDPSDLPEQTDPVQTDPIEPTIAPNLDDTIILQYQALYEMNRDMVGWIQIPNTSVDYPVVQTPKYPNFYLRRNFYKEYATCGTIYAREACDVNKPSDNVTLYGHNMKNGTMFADLHKYKDKSFWEKNRFVYFDTLSEYHTYEIFSVFTTTADLTKGFTYHIYDTFYEERDFNNFVSTCKNLDYYETGINPVFGDKLLTLSTCDKSMTDGRLVVVCRRIF